jgi:hypothetical protein
VAYDAPLLAVVPRGEAVVGGLRAVIEQAMAEGGPRRAAEAFMRANGGDDAVERWLASTDPDVVERMLGNGAVFFQIELPAFAVFVPDTAAMRTGGVPLTVVSGEDNRDTWFGAASRWLAAATGAAHVELPGGHGGFVTDPGAFLALVRRAATTAG